MPISFKPVSFFLTLEFFVFDSLHEMNLEKRFNERAPWQAVDSSIPSENIKIFVQIFNHFSICFQSAGIYIRIII